MMAMLGSRWLLAAPFLTALALAHVLDLGALALGALLGVASFVALQLARRPVSVQLGALALAGAFALGLTAAIFSALLGQSVREMAASFSNPVGVGLAVATILLGVFGALCLAAGVISGRRE
jgi:hypothetical protein